MKKVQAIDEKIDKNVNCFQVNKASSSLRYISQVTLGNEDK